MNKLLILLLIAFYTMNAAACVYTTSSGTSCDSRYAAVGEGAACPSGTPYELTASEYATVTKVDGLKDSKGTYACVK
jgi:hypothetical protein